MTRLALALAAVLLVASTATTARAADPLDCVPNSAHVVVVADNPRKLAEVITGLDAFKQAQQLAPVRQLYDSTTARRLLQMLAFAEKELGAKWPELLDQVGGNGVALAVNFYVDPAPALLVLSGKDEKQVEKAYALALRIVEEELARKARKKSQRASWSRGSRSRTSATTFTPRASTRPCSFRTRPSRSRARSSRRRRTNRGRASTRPGATPRRFSRKARWPGCGSTSRP